MEQKTIELHAQLWLKAETTRMREDCVPGFLQFEQRSNLSHAMTAEIYRLDH